MCVWRICRLSAGCWRRRCCRGTLAPSHLHVHPAGTLGSLLGVVCVCVGGGGGMCVCACVCVRVCGPFVQIYCTSPRHILFTFSFTFSFVCPEFASYVASVPKPAAPSTRPRAPPLPPPLPPNTFYRVYLHTLLFHAAGVHGHACPRRGWGPSQSEPRARSQGPTKGSPRWCGQLTAGAPGPHGGQPWVAPAPCGCGPGATAGVSRNGGCANARQPAMCRAIAVVDHVVPRHRFCGLCHLCIDALAMIRIENHWLLTAWGVWLVHWMVA